MAPGSSLSTLPLPSLAQTCLSGLVVHTLWPLPASGQYLYHVGSVSLTQVPLRDARKFREMRSGSAYRVGGALVGERGWDYGCYTTELRRALAPGCWAPNFHSLSTEVTLEGWPAEASLTSGKVQTDQAAKLSVSVRPFSPKERFTRRTCCKNRGSSGTRRTVGFNATGTPSLPPSMSVSDSLGFILHTWQGTWLLAAFRTTSHQ